MEEAVSILFALKRESTCLMTSDLSLRGRLEFIEC